MSNDYWISQAAQAEAQLDQLKRQFDEMCVNFERRINELEYMLIQANSNIMNNSTSTEDKNEND